MRLCITADDFGLTPGVNAAVVDLFEAGALSHASALVCSDYVEDGIKGLPERFHDRIGLHLCLDGEMPISPANRIPTLVTEAGRLKSRGRMVADILTGRVERQDLETETRAQVERLLSLGIQPKYLDGHGHLHVLPVMASIVGSVVREYGISRVRRPVEMPSLALAAAPRVTRLPVSGLISMAAIWAFRGPLRGLAKTDRFIGLAHSGHLTAAVLDSWIRVLRADGSGAGTSTLEVMCHPGFEDEALKKYEHWQYEHKCDFAAAIKLKQAFPEHII